MKSLFAFGVAIILAAALAAPASAQFGARSGALGGGFVSRGMSRPLGGITPTAPARPGIGANRNFRGVDRFDRFDRFGSRRGVLPFAYSIYIPDYFDNNYYYEENGYPYGYGAAPPAPAYPGYPAAPPAPQQPVIINQYFGGPEPPQSSPPPANNSNNNNPQTSGGPIGDPQNYYLIAFRNRTVAAALAYWVEDKTLHYVTMQNTHNQASLDLIDLDRTKTLNRDRDVPFSIAGQ
jgi:hypothetical protein